MKKINLIAALAAVIIVTVGSPKAVANTASDAVQYYQLEAMTVNMVENSLDKLLIDVEGIELTITDPDPELWLIRYIVKRHEGVLFKLDLSKCTAMTSIVKGAFIDCSGLTNITIPDSVTSIGSSAFSGCSSLTSVTIPDSVTSIGESAFSGCSRLTSVIISDSVTSIGQYAFWKCSGLRSVTIGKGVTSIGIGVFWECESLASVMIGKGVKNIEILAFDRCSGLTAINVVTGNTAYCSVDGVLFSKNKTALILCPGGKKGTYTIPDSVTSIGDYAFFGCEGLTAINVGARNTAYCSVDGVLFSKDKTALIRCPSGKKGTYTIPDEVTCIWDYAFDGCSGLTSVMIGKGVTSIGEGAFYGCREMTTLTVKAITPPIFGEGMLYHCDSLTAIYVPTSSVDAYKQADGWSDYSDIIQGKKF